MEGEEGKDGEVELLDRGEAHAADDRDEAQPLSLGDLAAVERDAEERRKGGDLPTGMVERRRARARAELLAALRDIES